VQFGTRGAERVRRSDLRSILVLRSAATRPSRFLAGERGAASVEHAALVLLAAAVAFAAIAGARLVAQDDPTPDLASALLRKQRCAVAYPNPCWQDPLTEAYGRRIAGAVRALAPPPQAVDGLVGVDYRQCRSIRCATPKPGTEGLRLTLSNRRTTAYSSIREGEPTPGSVTIDYWIYRPTIGWEHREAQADATTLDALAGTPLLESADPQLIPLETLLGRDEARFAVGEDPPWQGEIESRWGR
jgi:Flp pilus assembly pilin Flp